MDDKLKDLMRSAYQSYVEYGVAGSEGARAMKEGLARIEALEAALAKADDAMQEYENLLEQQLVADEFNLDGDHEAIKAYRATREATK